MKIIKNFLDNSVFLDLKKQLMGQDLEWHYHNSQTPLDTDDEYFDHCFYNKYEISSHRFDLIKPIIEKLKCKSLIQIRANLLIKKEEAKFSEFHTDYSHECNTAIFYINSCNGYTEFFDEKKSIVNCEENKIVIFNSQIKHRAVSQTDTKQRIVINLNYF